MRRERRGSGRNGGIRRTTRESAPADHGAHVVLRPLLLLLLLIAGHARRRDHHASQKQRGAVPRLPARVEERVARSVVRLAQRCARGAAAVRSLVRILRPRVRLHASVRARAATNTSANAGANADADAAGASLRQQRVSLDELERCLRRHLRQRRREVCILNHSVVKPREARCSGDASGC